MPTNVKTAIDNIQMLTGSPIHGVKQIGEHPVDISLLDTDPTNPGSDAYSKRYKRREKPISERYDILGGIIYPLVVCTKGDGTGRFRIVDGHGRRDEAVRRNQKETTRIIFPPLNLEQRILLRQVLNAAQEPFDTPLVLRDLHLLARERNLDLTNDMDLRALLTDLPVNIRKHEDKLKVQAKWPSDVSDKIGIDGNEESGVIGYDKIKETRPICGCGKETPSKRRRPISRTRTEPACSEAVFHKRISRWRSITRGYPRCAGGREEDRKQ